MTDLTNGISNIHGVPAPEGMRDKVLGRLDFRQTGVRRNPRRLALQFALLGAIAVVLAAILFPVFSRARESASRAVREGHRAVVRMPAAAEAPRQYSDLVDEYGGPLAKAKRQAPADLNVELAPTRPAQPARHPAVAQSSAPAVAEAPAYDSSQMIIKTADLRVQVKQFQQAYDRAALIARSVGGYVTDSSADTQATQASSGCLTIRVPVYAFERALQRLGELGKVRTKTISGEDVTGEAVDIESRLRNKRAEERQYLEIMNRARRIADIVVVSNELYRVRGEIEEMQGRLSYLKKSSAMSTISLTLSEHARPKAGGPSLGGTFGDAVGSLAATGSALARAGVWLAVYSPFWAIPLGAYLLLRRRILAQADQPGTVT